MILNSPFGISAQTASGPCECPTQIVSPYLEWTARLMLAFRHDLLVRERVVCLDLGESLQGNDGPALSASETSCLRPALHSPEDGVEEDLGELREHLAATSEQPSEIEGWAEDGAPRRRGREAVMAD